MQKAQVCDAVSQSVCIHAVFDESLHLLDPDGGQIVDQVYKQGHSNHLAVLMVGITLRPRTSKLGVLASISICHQ